MNALSRRSGDGEVTDEHSLQLAARDRSDDDEMNS
jgi:hypothetical protein